MIVEPITIAIKTTPNSLQAKGERANGRTEREKAEPKPDDVVRLTEKVAAIQKNLQLNKNVDLDFSVTQGSGDIVITVRDASTGKVIREIPPEEMRNLASKIDSMAGRILDLKV